MKHATVGVVIPAKNEQQYIGRCIVSVHAAADAVDVDVVVVDNQSQDNTGVIATESGARVVFSASSSIGEIRNIGASNVLGGILAYIDADCEAPARWVHAALEAFEDPDVAAVAGYLDLPQDANWVQRAWALPLRERSGVAPPVVGASFFIRRTVFDEIGGFDPLLKTGEDSDIARRLLGLGYQIRSEPFCNVVHHGYPSTLAGTIDRQIWQVCGRYGRAGFWNKTILAACGYALALILIVGSAMTAAWAVTASAMFVAGLAPTAFMFNRLRRSDYRMTMGFLLGQYVISTVYVLGRALGVAIAVTGFPYKREYK